MIVASCVGTLTTVSCTKAGAPLSLSSQDPLHDQQHIATYYRREATLLRRKSVDVKMQAAAYERLFGRDSEWVSGARLLTQFYEEEANERDRLATQHLGQIGGRSPVGDLIQP